MYCLQPCLASLKMNHVRKQFVMGVGHIKQTAMKLCVEMMIFLAALFTMPAMDQGMHLEAAITTILIIQQQVVVI